RRPARLGNGASTLADRHVGPRLTIPAGAGTLEVMARQWRRRSEAAAAPPRAGDGGPTPVIGAASRRASGASAAGAVLVALALCARPGSAQTTLADVPEETPPEVEAPARRSLLG